MKELKKHSQDERSPNLDSSPVWGRKWSVVSQANTRNPEEPWSEDDVGSLYKDRTWAGEARESACLTANNGDADATGPQTTHRVGALTEQQRSHTHG